jgi:hypothetical protein
VETTTASTRTLRQEEQARTGEAERKTRPAKTKREGGSPRKTLRGGKKGAAGHGLDAGDGRMVFEQLRKYLRESAPEKYVQQTVLKLVKLSKERRFRAYMKLLSTQQRQDIAEGVLRANWQDPIPFRLRETHDGLSSFWGAAAEDHQGRLAHLLHQWIIQDRTPQPEIEERLRFFCIVNGEEEESEQDMEVRGTFLEAVRPFDTTAAMEERGEKEGLRAVCMQPANPTTKVRQRTPEEAKAFVMMLNHEIEVPMVSPFLRQSMTISQLAVFEDIFMALEYPLYAHLAPGQKFYDNLPTSAILALIGAGPEAAKAHKLKIEEFKRENSRFHLDMAARTLKVTFKGREKALKSTGWPVPLANRLLPLVDYEVIRERAKRTHELIMLYYYSFVVEVHKGVMTSRQMLKILTTDTKLTVQALEHTILPAGGIQER